MINYSQTATGCSDKYQTFMDVEINDVKNVLGVEKKSTKLLN